MILPCGAIAIVRSVLIAQSDLKVIRRCPAKRRPHYGFCIFSEPPAIELICEQTAILITVYGKLAVQDPFDQGTRDRSVGNEVGPPFAREASGHSKDVRGRFRTYDNCP